MSTLSKLIFKKTHIIYIMYLPCSEGSQISPSTCENSESGIVGQSDAILALDCCKIPAAFVLQI